MALGQNDVIMLLGAGCSFKAGIRTSPDMLRDLHNLLEHDEAWKKYHSLYCRMRGLLLQTDAMRGKFEEILNIESIVAALEAIKDREKNPLYPFVGAIDGKFTELAGSQFEVAGELRQQILNKLIEWICPKEYEPSAYYRHIFDFAADYAYGLRVFTLNYDLCLERNAPPESQPERGFGSGDHQWDYKRFDPDNNTSTIIYYYKMHGSIDWERDQNHGNVIKQVAHPSRHPDLIFGTVNKLQSFDPYLFYAYQFRQYSLSARVILVIGYSFSDSYVNDILKQALESDDQKKIVAVSPSARIEDISHRLGLRDERQVVTIQKGAEAYLPELTIKSLCEQAGIETEEPDDPMSDAL